ncbi:MAG: helix-turn-helix domain-containing protein [Janthinobacterium lividum]
MTNVVVFTAEMDAVLRQMRAQDAGVRRIADKLGVSASTVTRRIKELGLREWGRGGADSRL